MTPKDSYFRYAHRSSIGITGRQTEAIIIYYHNYILMITLDFFSKTMFEKHHHYNNRNPYRSEASNLLKGFSPVAIK